MSISVVGRPRNGRSSTDLGAVARSFAADPGSWPVTPVFDPVDRWYTRLAADADHEVWLLTWLPGQATELHDHGGSAGAFTIVTGELTEQTVDEGAHRPAERVFGTGAVRRFGARHVHRIVNTSTLPAVSVHVYGPALTTMTRYEFDQGVLVPIETRRAGWDW